MMSLTSFRAIRLWFVLCLPGTGTLMSHIMLIPNKKWHFIFSSPNFSRLVSLAGIMERESRVSKLSWHGNFTEFNRNVFFSILFNERKNFSCRFVICEILKFQMLIVTRVCQGLLKALHKLEFILLSLRTLTH